MPHTTALAFGGVLLLVVSAGCRSVPGSSPSSSVRPSETTAYLKGRMELSLLAQPATGTDVALSGCYVRLPRQRNFKTLAEADGKAEVEGRLEMLGSLADGSCGVRVKTVVKEDDGDWALRAVFKSDSSATSAGAHVHVEDFSASVVPDRPSVSEGNSFGLSLVTTSPNSTAWSSCVVVLPKGDVVELAAASRSGAQATGRVVFDVGDGGGDPAALLAQGRCAVRVSQATSDDRGRWVLEATDKETGVVLRGAASVNVYMLAVTVRPSRVVAMQGEKVLLKLGFSSAPVGQHPWTGCQAVGPDGQAVLLAGAWNESQREQSAAADTVRPAAAETDLSRSQCAALIGPLERRHGGVWRLEALEAVTGATATVRSAKAIIDVKGPYQPSAANVTLAPGTQRVTLSCGPEEALSCTLRDPLAGETAFRGPCKLQLDRVRERHRGVWKCAALLPGYARPVEDTVLLQLAEPTRTETGVLRSASEGRVVLTCRLEGSSPCPDRGAASCHWEPPAPSAPLLLREAVRAQGADGRYSYAGRGLGACDCSLALATPLRPEDLGVWRCIIGLHESRTRGSFVTLAEGDEDARSGSHQPRQPRKPRARVDAVPAAKPMLVPSSGVVAPGTPLTVGCRAARPLVYCWLRTPHGDLLTLDEDWRSEDYGGSRYAGLGLELGECGLRVQRAAANHSGTWRCGMGVAVGDGAGPDEELAVSVVVSESLLVAVHPNVTATAVSAPAVLHCRTPLAEGLRYCRFQRPDGSSIHLADATGAAGAATPPSGRFRYDGLDGGLSAGVCGVAISPVSEEDFGEWTCTVALAGDSPGLEQKASITLRAPEADVAEAALVGLGVALLGVAAITVVVIGGRHYWRMRSSARGRRRAGSSASWLSEDEDHGLELRRARHSPSPSASASARRTRSSATRVSGLATTRLPARTRRSGGRSRSRPGLEPRPSRSPGADEDFAQTRASDEAAGWVRETTPSSDRSGFDETPPFSRKKQ